MTTHTSSTSLFFLLSTIALIAGPGLAQPATTPAVKDLNDVVVTARRRSESIQSTPVAVSVVNAALIDARMATTIVDFGKSVPNSRFDAVGPQGRAGMIAIRGINYASTNQAGDPSTPLYIDGIYQSLSKLNAVQMFDLETVEILRGPQPTLFGRNAFAGAVNIRTRKPQFSVGGYVELKAATFGREEIRAAVDLPLSVDQAALRLALLNSRSDGHYKSIRDAGAPLGGDDHTAFRLSGVYVGSPSWNLNFKYEFIRDRGDPSPVQNASTTPTQATPQVPAQTLGNVAGEPPNFFVYPAYWTNVYIPDGQQSFIDQHSIALTTELSTEGGKVTWTSGYQNTDDGVIVDPAGGRIAYNNQYFQTSLGSISHEIRYLGELSPRWQMLVGVHYLDDDLDYGNITYSQYTPLAGANAQVRALQRRRGTSVFGEIEFRASDAVRFNVSGRYMHEDKDFAIRRTPRPPALGINPGVFLPVTSYETARISWSDFSPALSVDWQIHSNAMLYAAWTHGYKSGGFAVQAPSLLAAGPYEPEEVETLEAGIKTQSFDGRLRFNATVFRNHLTNLQRTVNRTENGVLVNRVFNAAAAVTRGVELEAEYRSSDALILRSSLGILDAYYESFCANIGFSGGVSGLPASQPCGNTPGNLDNSRLPLFNAPEWQASMGATWQKGLGEAGSLRLHAELNYTSPLFTEDRPFPLTRRSDLTLLDLSLQWQSPAESFYATLYAHNALDDVETQQSIRSGNTLTVLAYLPPRRYGIAVGRKF
ncbi:MAG: hypothetical protein RL580_386 [Pseudomonadota bacterium]